MRQSRLPSLHLYVLDGHVPSLQMPVARQLPCKPNQYLICRQAIVSGTASVHVFSPLHQIAVTLTIIITIIIIIIIVIIIIIIINTLSSS